MAPSPTNLQIIGDEPKSFLLKEARIVGGYALQPVWGDGHDTGLYAYPFLRKLGDALHS
jgi:DUF971 family protein